MGSASRRYCTVLHEQVPEWMAMRVLAEITTPAYYRTRFVLASAAALFATQIGRA
jgi:hypothetical protein